MAVLKPIRTSKISDLWNNLGSFWSDFENKDLVEILWSGIIDSSTNLQKSLYYTTLSRTISTLPPIINSTYDFYTVITSGVNRNSIIINSGHYFELPKYTYFITGLYEITYSGTTNSRVETLLSENINYSFDVNTNYLLSLSGIHISGGIDKLYMIYNTKQINPVLLDVYGQMIGYDWIYWKENKYKTFVRGYGNNLSSMTYITSTTDSTYIDWNIKNLKYFIWSLVYYQKTIKSKENIKNLIGISAGLPFTWYSGIVMNVSATRIDVDHGEEYIYRYLSYYNNTLSGSSYPFKNIISGQSLKQFECLASGITIYDYLSNSGLIGQYMNKEYKRTSTVLIEIISGLIT